MIRQCTLDDVDWLVDLSVEFSNRHYDVPINREKSKDYITLMVEHGVCYRTDTGCIVGVIAPDPFRDWVALVEIAWFTYTPGDGLALLNKFIQHGRDSGVDEVRMTTLERNKSVAKLLERIGFSPIETSHRLLL